MKAYFPISLFSAIALLAANSSLFGQERGSDRPRVSPNAAVSQTIGTTVVSVTYGRPGLKGRSLESLAPEGRVWRTGANESAAIAFSGDVKVGGQSVEAGTYSLYAIPGEKEWTIIINSKLSWGTRYDEAMDVARTKASVSQGPEKEWFTIDFDSLSDTKAHLNLRWGSTVVAVPIAVE